MSKRKTQIPTFNLLHLFLKKKKKKKKKISPNFIGKQTTKRDCESYTQTYRLVGSFSTTSPTSASDFETTPKSIAKVKN